MNPSTSFMIGDMNEAGYSHISYRNFPYILEPEDIEVLEERSAIMEFEGGLERIEAERLALEQFVRERCYNRAG